jgi:hypothetical protein
MPRRSIAVVCTLALLAPAVACAARNSHSAFRLEGGYPMPGDPDLFDARYDPSFSLRAVGDRVVAEHLSLRMATEYAGFSHARTRTYVSGGGAWNLSTLVGLTVWPFRSTAPVQPYLTFAVGTAGFAVNEVVIDTGSGPRKVGFDYKNALGSALELGATAFPGDGGWGVSLAAERLATDSPLGMASYLSYTAGLAFRFDRTR